jgi:hypothetical protein
MDRIIVALFPVLSSHTLISPASSRIDRWHQRRRALIGLEIHTHLLCKKPGPPAGIWGGVAWLEPADKPHAPFQAKTQLPPSASPPLPIRFGKGSTREGPCSVGGAACLPVALPDTSLARVACFPAFSRPRHGFWDPPALTSFSSISALRPHTPQIAAPSLRGPLRRFACVPGTGGARPGSLMIFVNRRLTVICARPEGGPRPKPLPW